MKNKYSIQCVECQKKRRGLSPCYRVEQSKIEDRLGHITYQCSRCKVKFKVVYPVGLQVANGRGIMLSGNNS